jgi:hypothetical protein
MYHCLKAKALHLAFISELGWFFNDFIAVAQLGAAHKKIVSHSDNS